MVKNGLSNPDCSEEVSQAVLRFITFEILSLTHTCCRENKDFVVESFTTKDAAEIHGERWLFEDFEALMSSLKEESKQSDVLLWEFIQGDCSIWMREHLQSIHKLPFKGSLYAALAPDEYQAMESLYKTSLDTEMLANHPDYSDTLIPMLTEDHSDTDVSTHEPVPNGYKQFQWTCSHCGRVFTETVRELTANAAEDWVRQLNQAQGAPCSTRRRVFENLSQIFNGLFESCRHKLNQITQRASPQQTLPSLDQGIDLDCNSRPDKKYFLICVSSGGLEERLIHVEIEPTATDEQLYTALCEAYNSARGFWKWANPRALSRIEWKQFHIYHSDRIALSTKAEEDWPQCGRSACKTGCSRADDYEYSPRPATTDPPIPQNALNHFLQCPAHAGSKAFQRNIIPKRDNHLILGPDEFLREGWCLVFKETLSWRKVVAIQGANVAGSLAFTLVWAKCYGDGSISDAFAPGCWMLAVGTIIITLIYDPGR